MNAIAEKNLILNTRNFRFKFEIMAYLKVEWRCQKLVIATTFDKMDMKKLNSIWDPLTCELVKNVKKQDLPGIQVTTFFGVNNLGNK